MISFIKANMAFASRIDFESTTASKKAADTTSTNV
jgi:hypothetical protein